MGLRKKFKDSDFSRSIEITREITRDNVKGCGHLGKVLSCLLVPPGVVVTYACCKYDKITDKSFYEKFYCSPDSPDYILSRLG